MTMISNRTLKTALLLLGVLLLIACQPPVETVDSTETATFQPGSATLQDDGDINTEGVLAEGQLVPLRFTNLSFQTTGRVSEIFVAEGDDVEAGDPLIQLDTTDFELALAQAEARLQSAQGGVNAAQAQLTAAQARITTAELGVTAAQANLDLVLAGPRPEQIEALERRIAAAEAGVAQAAGNRDASLTISNSDIEAARAQVASAQANFDAVSETYANIIDACFTDQNGNEVCPLYGPVEENTRFQLEAAELNLAAAQATLDQLLAGPTFAQQSAASGSVTVANANLASTQAQLDLLLAGATPEQIEQAEVAVNQAELAVTQAEVAVTQAEAAVTQAEAAVTTAQAGVDGAQVNLDRLTLTAPYDGSVARINITVGELASNSVPIVTFADFSSWLVETTDLTELDIADVTEGSNVEIELDAIPNEIINGTVTNVALQSAISQGDTVYEVEIELEPTDDLPLRWGMTAFVSVER